MRKAAFCTAKTKTKISKDYDQQCGHYTAYQHLKQGSKCPSLPGFTHGFYPGKPGLGFKPYFGKVGTWWVFSILMFRFVYFMVNLTDKTSFFFKNISIRIYNLIHSFTTNVYYILYPLKFHDTMNFEYL